MFVICFISQWVKRSKHGLFVFRPKKTNNMEEALFDWPILLQYDVKTYRLISRKFTGMIFFSVCLFVLFLFCFVLLLFIWRILHGRAGIRNFSSSVEKYFTSDRSEQVKYFFQHEKRNFVSPSDHVMFYLLYDDEIPNHFI